jgi:hypothetical protein
MNTDRHGQSNGIGSDGEPGKTAPEEGIIFHLSFAIFHLVIWRGWALVFGLWSSVLERPSDHKCLEETKEKHKDPKAQDPRPPRQMTK